MGDVTAATSDTFVETSVSAYSLGGNVGAVTADAASKPDKRTHAVNISASFTPIL